MCARTVPTLAFAIVLAAVLTMPSVAADTFAIDAGHSDVSFQIRHLVSKVRGGFGSFEGRIVVDDAVPQNSSVAFSIDVSSIDTGVEDRDRHLRAAEFFDVENHPRITFESTQVRRTAPGRYLVTGPLSIRGVSKNVTLPVEHLGRVKDPWGQIKAGFTLTTTIDRKDFGIIWNQTLDDGGLLLGDEVEIEINLEAVQREASLSSG